MADNQAREEHLAWISQVQEEAIEPELPICDAHHHLWLDTGHTVIGPEDHGVQRTDGEEHGARIRGAGFDVLHQGRTGGRAVALVHLYPCSPAVRREVQAATHGDYVRRRRG